MMMCLMCGVEAVGCGPGALHDEVDILECAECGTMYKPGLIANIVEHYEYRLSLLQLGACVWETSNLTQKERVIRDRLWRLEQA